MVDGTEGPFSVSALRRLASQVGDWYRRPDQFESFSRYLSEKQLTGASRFLVVTTLTLVAAVLVLIRFSTEGPTTTGQSIGDIGILIATVLMAVILSTRRSLVRIWSYVFVIYSEVGIAAAMLLYSNPLAALAHGAMFAVIGGYIAFFHNVRMQTAHLVWATIVVIGVVTRTAVHDGYTDVAALVASAITVGLTIYVVPIACQFVLSILGTDAHNSRRDPLTGLLNRRGLADEVRLLLERTFADPADLVVAIADINRFKAINDEFGHTVGDAVISSVGSRLISCAGPSALIARIGGDEFVVVDTCSSMSKDRLESELLRSPIISDEHPDVALSIGIAMTAGPFDSVEHALAVYPNLLRRADQAMYSAKARGGHAVVVADSE